jgi:hypothetical protein
MKSDVIGMRNKKIRSYKLRCLCLYCHKDGRCGGIKEHSKAAKLHLHVPKD